MAAIISVAACGRRTQSDSVKLTLDGSAEDIPAPFVGPDSGCDAGDDGSIDANEADVASGLDVGLDVIGTSAPDAAGEESEVGDGMLRLKLVAGTLGGSGTVDGVGATARFAGPKSVAFDGAGNLFVADGSHTIRKIVIATGAVTTIAGVAGSAGDVDGTLTEARFNAPTGVVFDGAGNLLVLESSRHVIRKIAIATGAVTTLAGSTANPGNKDGVGSEAQLDSPLSGSCDGAGNLFIIDHKTIRKVVIATGAVTTLAGTPTSYGSADGTGADARFNDPRGIVSDRAGNLFVAEFGSYTIRKVEIATGVVTTFAGSAEHRGNKDGTGIDAEFFLPRSIAMDGAGDLFVSDGYAIRKIDVATGAVTTIAGSGTTSGSSDGVGSEARFSLPSEMSSDGAGNLFIADTNNSTIRRLVTSTGVVTTLAGAPAAAGNVDGVGSNARFSGPHGIASDGAGNVFVADGRKIRRVALATGLVTTLPTHAEPVALPDGGMAALPDFFPGEMAYIDGNLYLSDSGYHTIWKIVVATGDVTLLAGTPQKRGNTNGVGAAALFYGPAGIVSDGRGGLLVADSYNHVIRRIDLETTMVTTFTGSGASGIRSGSATVAEFNLPSGLACDGHGNLFVTDMGNNTVRSVDLSTGEVAYFAGLMGSSSQDGIGPEAQFNLPTGITYDGAGALYVADTGNHTVRRIDIASRAVTTVIGSPRGGGVVLGPVPAGLSKPYGLLFLPAFGLLITDSYENALLLLQ
jgi:sugar lactone lactonase YvrE